MLQSFQEFSNHKWNITTLHNNAKLNTQQGWSIRYQKNLSLVDKERIIFNRIHYILIISHVPDIVNFLVNKTVMVPALRI